LLSALRAHNLTTQSPHDVWIAIDRKARLPKSGAAKLRVVRFSGTALSEGIEHRQIEGVRVPIYNVAKTVAASRFSACWSNMVLSGCFIG
jgi:predicted transcriptional regulator of viral defense system